MSNGLETRHSSATTPVRGGFECFTYLTVEKSRLYRVVMRVFSDARAEFLLHLRPSEVVERLRGMDAGDPSDEEVEAALDALVHWGNLQSYRDPAEVSTIAEFQRRRLLYQLTAAGDAAERAAAEFVRSLERPITLEMAALGRIQDYLRALDQLAHSSPIDAGKVLTALRSIADDVEQLTLHAQSFFRWLHEQTEARGADLETFLAYKERLIEYLRDFLAELASQSGAIAEQVELLQPTIAALLSLAGEHEAAGAFVTSDAEREALGKSLTSRWMQRWQGLRHWFVGAGGVPQVRQLRQAASAAIPRLLSLAAQLHDRRATQSDRRADLIELAAWFAAAPDDRQAHRLWRAAFGNSPARHLRIDQTTIEQREQHPVSANLSWLDAPAIYISPQLRQTGRLPAAAPSRQIIDRQKMQAAIRQRLMAKEEQSSQARAALLSLGRRRLSEIGWLEHEALLLLIDLLDRAALQPGGSAVSEDGSLRIRLEQESQPTTSTVETRAGYFHGRDAWIEIEDTWADDTQSMVS